jgi:glycosyltransferase involved in cell wall biosynthesis
MTIVHIEEGFHPSYGYQVQNFCRHHSPEHRIHVVTGAGLRGNVVKVDPAVMARLDTEFTRETGAAIHRLPIAWQWHHKLWLKGLHSLLEALQPDVIFAHGLEYLSLPRLLFCKWDRRCVVVTDSHDLPTASFHKFLRRAYRFVIQDWCVQQINLRRITCYYTALPVRENMDDYGINPILQRDLPIGTTMQSFFHDSPAREALRREWGAGSFDRVLLYTGKHDEDKSPHFFYEAVSSLGAVSPAQLMVVSVGAQDSAYFEKTCQPVLLRLREQGIKVLISPAIPSSKLREYYSAADIGVFPCRHTLSCLDAMACGLPTVMQDDATNRDRLQVGGLVYEEGNLAALTGRIRELLENPAQRESLGRAGIADMRQRYDYGVIVARLESELAAAFDKRMANAGTGGKQGNAQLSE